MEFFDIIGRLLFGGFFVYNGINHFIHKKSLTGYAHSKHIPSPELAVTLSGAVLIASGLSIVFGIFFNISLMALIAFLFITSVTMHAFWKDTDKQARASDQTNFFKNMALLGAAIMLLDIDLWPFGF